MFDMSLCHFRITLFVISNYFKEKLINKQLQNRVNRYVTVHNENCKENGQESCRVTAGVMNILSKLTGRHSRVFSVKLFKQ